MTCLNSIIMEKVNVNRRCVPNIKPSITDVNVVDEIDDDDDQSFLDGGSVWCLEN